MITLLLADDHTYIRKGLRNLIESTADMEVVATASNGIEAIAKACTLKPDIVVIDIYMPLMDGIEATRQIRECSSQTRVLALSIHENREYVESALQSGAAGYVLKDEIGNELLEAIRSLHSGKQYFSQRIAVGIDPHIERDDNPEVGETKAS